MSKTLYALLFALATISTGCKKSLSTGDADFEVNIANPALSLEDTAKFILKGNPDMINFYSGEAGKRFEYRDRVAADGTPILSFRTVRANGTQPNSLQLLISTDFKGVVQGDTATTKANISTAGWTDITSRANLSTGSTTALPSGDIDLSDFATAGKPIFFAFKYNGTAGTAQSKWTITNFTIKNNLPDSTSYEIANLNTSTTPYTVYGVSTFSPGFVGYALQNTFNWAISSTQLVITGATPASNAKAVSEAWAVVGPINLKKVVPDAGQLVKSPTQNLNNGPFIYKYSAKGAYNAVFTGGSLDINRTNFVQKSIKVTVN